MVATVTAAFADDPAWAFMIGDDYDRLATLFAGALFDLRVGVGGAWVADGAAAVALWEPPGGGGQAPDESRRVWEAFRVEAGEPAWHRMTEYNRCIDAVRPATPYWYLGVLATHPDRRGEGLATAVIAPVLEQADRDGFACCLETSTTGNRRFYEGRGFTEATEVHIDGGPRTWWLRRS